MLLLLRAYLLAAAAFSGVAVGQDPTLLSNDINIPIERVNRLTSPGQGQFATAGQPFPIQWQLPTPGTVSIALFRGSPPTAQQLYSIVDKTLNTGIYVWTPSTSLVTEGTQYSVQLTDDSTGQRQWSGPFGVSAPTQAGGANSNSGGSAGDSAVVAGAGAGNGAVAGAGAGAGTSTAAGSFVGTTAAVAPGGTSTTTATLQSGSLAGTAVLPLVSIIFSSSSIFAANWTTSSVFITSQTPTTAAASSTNTKAGSHSDIGSNSTAASSSQNDTSKNGSIDSGLSTGAKAGIGVGVPLAILAVAGIAYLAYRFASQGRQAGTSHNPKRTMSETEGESKRLALVISSNGADLDTDQEMWEVRTV